MSERLFLGRCWSRRIHISFGVSCFHREQASSKLLPISSTTHNRPRTPSERFRQNRRPRQSRSLTSRTSSYDHGHTNQSTPFPHHVLHVDLQPRSHSDATPSPGKTTRIRLPPGSEGGQWTDVGSGGRVGQDESCDGRRGCRYVFSSCDLPAVG